MHSDQTKTIPILSRPVESDPDREAAFAMPSKMREEVTRVAVGELSEQLAEFINSLSLVVDGLPSECGAYDVEELTFSLSVNASGKISLVGELAAGVSSGITVKIRKKRPATPE